ncbi:MAG: ribosome-associated translation inhibitor RaiA [Minisyncoccia bacterium]
MQIKIRSKNFELTPSIEDYVNRKISSLEKFFGHRDNVLCEVEIGKTTEHQKSGDIFRTEVNMVIPGDGQVFAVANESDLYASIDVVRDEAEREILTRKNKKITLFRRGASKLKNLVRSLNFKRK